MDRMAERHLPAGQVEIALQWGEKLAVGGNKFEVRWRKWTIVVYLMRCTLYLKTAFLE